MKVVCDRAALVESLSLVGGVIQSRTPKPILTCVRLSAKDGVLELSGTDLEVAMQLSTDRVEITQAGEALLPADKLNQIARESQDPTLSIEVSHDEAKIRGADSIFTIYGFPTADYPPIPGPGDHDPDFTISAGDFTTMVGQTIFATARETSRYAINGVLLRREGKKIELVATDGRRLALARGKCDEAANEETSRCIIPTKALNLLLKLAVEPEQPVSVIMLENQAIFVVGEEGSRATLATNLVEGSFPAYEDVIPKDQDKKVLFDVETLRSAVRRAALLTNEESKGVKLAFEDGGLTLTSRAPEVGEAEIKVPLESFEGSDIAIGFNPAFILDVLKVIDSQQLQFSMKTAASPGLFKTDDGSFMYILMPVSLK